MFLNARGRVLFEAILAPLDEASARWMAAGCAPGTQEMRGPAGLLRRGMVPSSSFPPDLNVVSPTPRGFYLCVPSAIVPLVLQHLSQYNLRRKVVVEDVSHEVQAMQIVPFQVMEEVRNQRDWSAQQRAAQAVQWAHASAEERRVDLARLLGLPATPTSSAELYEQLGVVHAMVDPRARCMGVRVLCRKESGSVSPSVRGLPPSFLRVEDTDASFIETYRVLHGIPRSPVDIVADKSLPLELGLRELGHGGGARGGVSFEKGCYLGQELTARTHFQGVLRKRVWPAWVAGDRKLVTPVGQPPMLAALMPTTNERVSSSAGASATELAWQQLQHYFPFLDRSRAAVQPDTPILRTATAAVTATGAPASAPSAKEAARVLSAHHNVVLSLLRTEHVFDSSHALQLQPTSCAAVAEAASAVAEQHELLPLRDTIVPYKPSWWCEDDATAAADEATPAAPVPDAATAATA